MKIIFTFLALLFSFSVVFSQVKLDSGLVAYYPFSGNAQDASGHGNNPVFNNAALTADAKGNANSAYHFNGIDNYIRIPNSAWLNMANKISLSLNVMPTGFYTGPCYNNMLLMKGDNDYLTGNYFLRFADVQNGCTNPSTIGEQFFGQSTVAANPIVKLNKWYSLVWTYDGVTARLYVDGVLQQSAVANYSTFTNSYDLFLGRLNNGEYPYWFNGNLDEVRIYNRALNTEEVKALVLSNATPTITSFSPSSGGNNAVVVINGTNFTGVTSVSFGGVAAKSFTVNSATKITAKVGTGATGVVKVTTTGGTASSATSFTFCVTPSVKITAGTTSPICAGTPVTFTATATNGGTAPVYQWQKNGVNVGSNSKTYIDNALQDGDSVICILTSNASPCVTTSNVSSNAIVFKVNPNLTPSVSIMANPGAAVCKGTGIQFTATVTNGGTTPVYKWMKNGKPAGSNSSSYTNASPVTGDSIYVTVTSNASCLVKPTVTSDTVIVRVDEPNPVIKITASKDSVICGSPNVIFKAVVTPSFLWQKNGVTVGNNTNTYSDSTLTTNDKIQCLLVSNASACNGKPGNIVNSNILTFYKNTLPSTPSAISGPAKVTAGQTGVVFSVAQQDSVMFTWKLPAGALITSGQGTNTITVNWGNTSGNVSVAALNSCGSSSSAIKKVTITASLSAAAIQSSASVTKTQVIAQDEIQLSPNPAGVLAKLVFNAKTQDKYVVVIADAQDKVLEVINGTSTKGENTVKINTSKYARGVYFVTVTNKENGKRSKKLVIGK